MKFHPARKPAGRPRPSDAYWYVPPAKGSAAPISPYMSAG